MQMKVIRVYSTIEISSDREYSFRINSLILYGRISGELTVNLEKLRILYWPTRLIRSKAIEIKDFNNSPVNQAFDASIIITMDQPVSISKYQYHEIYTVCAGNYDFWKFILFM